MRYLLLIYGDESAWDGMTPTPESLEGEMKRWGDYTDWLKQNGWHLGGEALQPTSDATTVREQNGKVMTTDGPFAETKEQLGGYYLIDAPNLDDAIEAASKMPNIVTGGSVEVRPIQEFD
jgi:hypothetical protein